MVSVADGLLGAAMLLLASTPEVLVVLPLIAPGWTSAPGRAWALASCCWFSESLLAELNGSLAVSPALTARACSRESWALLASSPPRAWCLCIGAALAPAAPRPAVRAMAEIRAMVLVMSHILVIEGREALGLIYEGGRPSALHSKGKSPLGNAPGHGVCVTGAGREVLCRRAKS